MTWVKLGHVFAPSGAWDWALEYAAFPTADFAPDGNVRVYYTALDARRYGSTGFVDIDFDNPLRIVSRRRRPVLRYGDMGEFDECGANGFSIVSVGGKRHLYYQGWQTTTRAPYLIFTGLAISNGADAPFEKCGRVPILERTQDEPYMRAAPFVIRDGNSFRMWYVACTQWTIRDGRPQYFVQIRTTDSADGIHWGDSTVCMSPEGQEYAVGRPCVIRSFGKYRMWFSIRSNSEPYRLGYAESEDGLAWTRIEDEQYVLKRSATGWDSEMVCYPFVIERGDRRLLFYNGNQHGATGFGVAVWR